MVMGVCNGDAYDMAKYCRRSSGWCEARQGSRRHTLSFTCVGAFVFKRVVRCMRT